MRKLVFALAVFLAGAVDVCAQTTPPNNPLAPTPAVSPPFEIVRENIDLEVQANGAYLQSSELTLRPLTAQGVESVRRFSFSYTYGYQRMSVVRAYTLKKDGTRIVVPPGEILYGVGETTRLGYGDTRTITVVLPNVEIGDQVTIVTAMQQLVPWFAGVFAENLDVSNAVAVQDFTLALTTPVTGVNLNIDASGLDTGPVETLGEKTRRSWHFHSDTPVRSEPGTAEEIDDGPHLGISTLSYYAAAARLHADLYRDKAQVTPAISDLANRLTANITDRRAQAKTLYEWVATHIKYVDIVLGAGGFTPHAAADVLHNAYGDCKDHVMLLKALLSAKNIESSAVLIRAGANQFQLPKIASPFLFDHLLTYIPEFQIYLDSTAEYAPFGVLPFADSGKTVLVTDTGTVAETPVAHNSTLHSETTLTVNNDGSADGDTKIVYTGAAAVDFRAQIAALPVDGEDNYFRAVLGPGSTGKLQRGSPDDLADIFSLAAHYHIANFITVPGPGAFPSQLGYKPFSFSSLIGGTLPPTRSETYVCPSLSADAKVMMMLPHTVKVVALPPTRNLTTQETKLETSFTRPKPGVVLEVTKIQMEHPQAVCSASYYAKSRDAFAKMLAALQTQIIYK
jgi:transglutaminase-like putative cysteine protease